MQINFDLIINIFSDFNCNWGSDGGDERVSPDFFPVKPVDYGRFLVISLGTGSHREKKYDTLKIKTNLVKCY